MKTHKVILAFILTLTGFVICQAQEQSFEFGIHETVSLNDLRPLSENQSRVILNQELKLDDPVVSYFTINDKEYIGKLTKDLGSANAYLLPTKSFGGNNSLALVSIKREAALSIEDISKAVPSTRGIELRFNYKGARKFAKLTKETTGKMIAFVINNEIWSMPMVNAAINGGVALITGIDDQEIVKDTCERINSQLK